ncbi:hypothetical protein Ddc_19425 [Ditylenchus destructor]|nr:hypothetical protein Ddc_19425 [Ditylenchus destructor]
MRRGPSSAVWSARCSWRGLSATTIRASGARQYQAGAAVPLRRRAEGKHRQVQQGNEVRRQASALIRHGLPREAIRLSVNMTCVI